MGVIKRGILGGFSGSVGNVVGSSWKGIATMKAKPLSVANPNTAGQIAQRTKMTNLVEFAKQILTDIIKPFNDRFASGMSGFNLFTQRNIDFFAGVNPSVGDLIISRGNVANVESPVLLADNSLGLVRLSWTDNSGVGNALATDELFVIMINRATGEMIHSDSGVARNASPFEGSFVGAFAVGSNIDLYYALRRADGTQVSDTFYLTTVVVA